MTTSKRNSPAFPTAQSPSKEKLDGLGWLQATAQYGSRNADKAGASAVLREIARIQRELNTALLGLAAIAERERASHEPRAVCECGHAYVPLHQTPGTECAVEDCPCGRYRAAPPPGAKCEWGYDAGDDVWHTTCGHMHVFMDRGPTDNDHKCCPYCGKGIDDLSRPSSTKEAGQS